MKKLYACLILSGILSGTPLFSQTLVPDSIYTNGAVRAMVASGDTLYIGGDFTYVGPSLPYGASIDKATGKPNYSFAKPNSRVATAAPDGNGGWYIGGFFTQVGGQPRNYIARINADGSLSSWNANADQPVLDIKVAGNL